MSIYDRSSDSQNHDRPNFVPIEPQDLFIEDPASPFDATLFVNRFIYRAGRGLMVSDGITWNSMPRTLWVPASDGHVGATAGWDVGADDGLVRLPASQTNATWITPIRGLELGDKIIAVRAIGQVESAGATATLLMDVRKTTAVVGDFSEVAVGSQATTGGLTADTLISAAILDVTGVAEVLASLEHVFIKLDGTTAAATDIAIAGFEVDVS